MTSLFNEHASRDDRSAYYGESNFEYLDESGRLIAKHIRAFLDDCFARYPQSDAASLRSRFRKFDDDKHNSALFELILHEWILRCGHKVIAIEPDLDHTSKNPDFHCQTRAGQDYILEAALVTGLSAESKTRNDLKQRFIGGLQQRATSPVYWLEILIEGQTDGQPPYGKIAQRLQRWINQLPDTGDISSLPHFIESSHGLSIDIYPGYRRKPGSDPSKLFSGVMPGASSAGIGVKTGDMLNEKARKYGDLGMPYYIALCSHALGSQSDTMDTTLLGNITCRVTTAPPREIISAGRANNGFWSAPNRVSPKRVNSVFMFDRLTAWRIPETVPVQFHNPDPVYDAPEISFRATQAHVVESDFNCSKTITLGEIFGFSHPDED